MHGWGCPPPLSGSHRAAVGVGHPGAAPIHPSDKGAPPTYGLKSLQAQELAGALMWFWVTIAYLIPPIVLTLRSLSPRRSEGSDEGQGLVTALKPGTR